MVFENVCRWFLAKFAAKWCGMIQDTTFQQIRARHVSSHGLEGQPEQETDITKDESQANDTWAQNAAHQDKGKVSWSRGSAAEEAPLGRGSLL